LIPEPSGTTIGDSLVAFRLARESEAPSLWSRTIDRPGGRFQAGAIGVALATMLAAIAFRRWRRRARLRQAARSGTAG
jgi:quinoprotein glucose dehydrogenase